MGKIKVIVFDWGDTLMRDYEQFSGPMVEWPHVEMVSGVEDTLMQLHKKFICCVASNAGASDAELMGKALERVNIKQYFQYLFTSKELGARKPSVEFFNEILERVGIAGHEGVMVGNDYNKDIVPAKSTGMKTILFSKTIGEEETLCADAVICSMKNLVSAVEKLKYECQ